MNKLLKAILIGLLFFTFSFVCSYATEEDNEETINNSSDIVSSDNSSTVSTRVSPINPYSQANLDLNNKLCIILISIGIVIILFAIAILIRLKR